MERVWSLTGGSIQHYILVEVQGEHQVRELAEERRELSFVDQMIFSAFVEALQVLQHLALRVERGFDKGELGRGDDHARTLAASSS
jgi:hypothetical protein